MLNRMEQHSSTDQQQQDNVALPEAAAQNSQHHVTRKKIGFIIAAIILLVGACVAAYLLFGGTGGNNGSKGQLTADQQKLLAQNDPFAQQYLQGCKEGRTVSFTQSPIPFDQLGMIEPMGKMTDGHVTPTDHVYIAPKTMAAADNTTDVVMPADGTVTVIAAMPAQYIGDKNQQTAPEDHRLVIAHNCKYVSIFIHVHALSEALRSAIGTALQPNEQKQVALELKAGDKLGKIGGNPVDWSLMDATKTLGGFITPDLYKGEPWKIHVIDPISVYNGTTKEQLIAKSLRSVEPYGGKIDYDKKGALIGNWFREGTNGYMGADQSRYWDGHLAVAPNYIDPASTVVSVGNWQGKAAQFAVKGAADPASITKGSGLIKYELSEQNYVTPAGREWTGQEFVKGIKTSQTGSVKGVAMFQVLDGEKLKVELFPGKAATQVSAFTSDAKIYVR
jgi:hypothetical protein